MNSLIIDNIPKTIISFCFLDSEISFLKFVSSFNILNKVEKRASISSTM